MADLPEYRSPRVSSELPDCSMPLTFDSYSRCSFGCRYCFAAMFKANNPALHEEDPLQAVNVIKLYKAMTGEATNKLHKTFYKHFYKRKFLLHWGGLADPFCRNERRYGVGYDIIDMLGDLNYPTLFSFKGKTILNYRDIIEKYSKQKNFAFQVSIVTASDKMSKEIEPGVPVTSKRLECLKWLSDMGYWTILRLRPFIHGITDKHLLRLLKIALKAGVRGISTEYFAIDGRMNKKLIHQYKYISGLLGTDDLLRYYSKLSPKERGGYMRLNRLVKERNIRLIYEFCVKHNLVFACSDPDFKELNMSGSCCGMPDDFPDNRLVENWTRNQLTFHVAQARKIWHGKAEKKLLLFHEVYGNESYLDDNELADENIGSISKIYAQRCVITLRHILQEKWNNLNSPANPRNYLHGKIMPNGLLDTDGNLIYEYSPNEYEKRWVDEGVDLTK